LQVFSISELGMWDLDNKRAVNSDAQHVQKSARVLKLNEALSQIHNTLILRNSFASKRDYSTWNDSNVSSTFPNQFSLFLNNFG
jgi:hypothetical protein